MRALSRVVWSEGMHLAQHHFQAQSKHFEDVAAFLLNSLYYRPYGVGGCELDAEALLNGTVSVVHARGIMPDGLAFHFPDEPPPEPLDIRTRFSPTHDSHVVLLAIPPERPGQPNTRLDGATNHGDPRFVAARAPMRDETTGRDEREVFVARKNFRLVLDADAGDLVALPLARVRRDGSGHFIYDPQFIPPCLQIGASPRLLELLTRLVEILESKADALMAERENTRLTLAEYASREIAGFWLSHAVHAAIGPLRYHLQTRSSHPEELFLDLAQFAGALCTFAFGSHPRDLPAYDHDRLEESFEGLDRHIRAHLEVVLPTTALTIPFRTVEEHFHLANVADRRSFGRAQWFLGVRSSAGQGDIAARVPRLVKVCSGRHIVRLVQEAFPGLTVDHVPTPPAELSPRIGTQYFSVHRAGPCWSSIVETGEVGVYVPAAIPDVELDLVIVLER